MTVEWTPRPTIREKVLLTLADSVIALSVLAISVALTADIWMLYFVYISFVSFAFTLLTKWEMRKND